VQRIEPFASRPGPAIVVQYCAECFGHASAGRTRWLAAGLAALLFGLSAAAALVLAWGDLPPALQALLAAGAALVPSLALLGRSPRSPHTTRGAAVWWAPRPGGGWDLVCTNARWAAALAGQSHATWQPLERRPWRAPWPVWMAAAVAALSVPTAHAFLGVTVHVINRAGMPAVVLVDGRHHGVVAPSTMESAAAGRRLRLVAGRRDFALVAKDGSLLAETRATLRPGFDHLLAVSADPVCFWVERNTYGRSEDAKGRSQAADSAREPLSGPGPLWALPGKIDSWFGPNPTADGADDVSSGGLLLALRQGRCAPGQSSSVTPTSAAGAAPGANAGTSATASVRTSAPATGRERQAFEPLAQPDP
jgi:hypothetical protein